MTYITNWCTIKGLKQKKKIKELKLRKKLRKKLRSPTTNENDLYN